MRLQDELAGTENRIGVARKNYNDALQEYNTFILQFPNSFWAGFTPYKENDAYFKARDVYKRQGREAASAASALPAAAEPVKPTAFTDG